MATLRIIDRDGLEHNVDGRRGLDMAAHAGEHD